VDSITLDTTKRDFTFTFKQGFEFRPEAVLNLNGSVKVTEEEMLAVDKLQTEYEAKGIVPTREQLRSVLKKKTA
jgi:hypothetical protein